MIKTTVVWAALATAPAGAAATASISPYWVQARHAFTLALTGESQMCVPEFSHQEAALIGGELVLSVLEKQRIGYLCTNATAWPYRTEFTVPGLDSGSYPVKVRWRSACEFDPAPCPVAYDPQPAGNLRVTDTAALAYHIKPQAVPAGQAAKLLLRGKFMCGIRFTDLSVDTARPSITLSFTADQATSGGCDTIVPGIEYTLPPLGAGVWQVYAAPMPYCAPGTICPYLRIAPQLAGALEVKGSALSTLAPARVSHAAVVAGGWAGFRADWRGVPRDAAGRRGAGPRAASESNMPGGKP